MLIKTKILEYSERNGMPSLCDRTGLPKSFFESIVNDRRCKHQKNKLDIVYEFLRMEKDEWYHENLKKWVKPTESILGDIFRKKRLRMSLSIEEVHRRIKVDSRQIARIEAGDSLPSFGSYTITSLLSLYEFSDQESEKIRWFIVILRDMVNINNSTGN